MDMTSDPDGRVRIKLDGRSDDNEKPISIPGLLSRVAAKHPNHPAMVSRIGPDGRRTTYTYRFVHQSLPSV